MHKAVANVTEFKIEEWTKIPLQLSLTLLDVTEKDSVLSFAPEEA